ncbi:MAG: YtxH domain-containing protein [Candidatus Pacebacteria bacterium]|nr:YtxH domain-containing protein [Candidatus Paceibacterota bacterium]
MNERERGNSFFSGFIAGGLIGAVLVFLFGTKEGRKIKKRLEKKGQELAKDLPGIVSDLEKRGAEFAQKAEEVKQTLEKKAEELSPKIKRKLDQSLASIEETQEKGRQTAARIRRRFFVKKGRQLG